MQQILDTGSPSHKDINNVAEHVSFVDNVKDSADRHGHATLVSGFIAAKNSRCVTGVAPDATMYFGKITDDQGYGDFNALVAAILWSVVKQVDIILISLGSSTDYPMLHDAISKASAANICVIAAEGNGNGDSVCYPGGYENVLSFKSKPKGKNLKERNSSNKRIIMSMPHSGLLTTFIGGKYTKVYGSSFAAAIGAGLSALVIEKGQNAKQKMSPMSVYSEVMTLSYD
jgi:major intracellular serine protease